MKKIILSIIIIILIAFILLNIDYSVFRKKTNLEKTHLKCLTGISRNDTNFKGEFGIINIFVSWETDFPYEIANLIKEKKSILMITWEPYLKHDKNKSILPGITEGKYDDLIKNFAYDSKNYGHPILLRWGHEMNGNWYAWSGVNNNDPAMYAGAFKHIHDIFQEIESKNVKFVFSINNEDVPRKKWNRFENYYPGEKYVDLIGIDMYNWGNTGKWFGSKIFGWRKPENILKPAYERVIKEYPNKPIIISEVGSSSSGGDKIKWMGDFFNLLKTRFTAVKAFVWFDINKETDWGISDNEDLWRIYKKETKDNFFTDDIKSFGWVFNTSLEK